MTARAFGYLKDPHDARDRVLGARPPGAVGARPRATHNLEQLRRTKFQVGSSCVGNTWAVLLQWFHARETGEDVALSAQHLYQHGLLALPGAAELDVQPDGGSYPRDVARAGQKLGVALERDWPASYETLGRRVPPAVAAAGMKFGGYDYHRVPLEQGAFLDALVGGPVAIGGAWWESWESFRAGHAFSAPEPGEIQVGGHAWLALDYDLTGHEPLVLCANWWRDWGFSEANQWHPKKPLTSLAWFELEALIPALGPRHYGIDGALTLRAAQVSP